MKLHGYDMQVVDRAYGRVVECQRRIGRQTVLVAAMAAQGHDTTLVQRTLDAMTASLAMLQQHWTSEMRALRSWQSLLQALG